MTTTTPSLSVRIPVRWRVPFGVVAVLVALAAAYAGRRALVALLHLPVPCFQGAGCLPVSPGVATAFMLGYDILVLGVVVWHVRSGGLLRAPSDLSLSRRQWLAALGAVTLAAGLARMVSPEAGPLIADEVKLASLAWEGLLAGRLPLTGINSSAGIPNPPFGIYYLAPVLWLFKDGPGAPAALLVYQGLIGTATAALTGWFALRWTGSARVGLAASVAYALGFWPLFLGRKVWQQDFLPLFALLYFDALLLLATRAQKRVLVWAAVWLVLMLQLHFLTITLAPLLLVALWWSRRDVDVSAIALVVLSGVVLMAPYLLWEASFDTSFRDFREFGVLSERAAEIDTLSLTHALGIAGAGTAEKQVSPFQSALDDVLAPGLVAASAGSVLFVVGLGRATWYALTERAWRRPMAMLVGWVAVPIVLLVRHTYQLSFDYFYYLLPVTATLSGFAVGWAPRPASRLPRWIGALWSRLGLVLLALYVAGSVYLLTTISASAWRLRTVEYAEPIGVVSAAARTAFDRWTATSRLQPILVGGHTEDVGKFRLALGAAVPWVGFDDCASLLAPPDVSRGAIYVTVDDTPASHLLLLMSGGTVQLVGTEPRPGGGAYRIYEAAAGAVPSLTFGAGLAYQWPDCRVTTRWPVELGPELPRWFGIS